MNFKHFSHRKTFYIALLEKKTKQETNKQTNKQTKSKTVE
jgi:hypothetical protein